MWITSTGANRFRLSIACGDTTEPIVGCSIMGSRDSGPQREFLGFIGSCTDITEMKRAEVALRESEKLAVVGRLAASIAHEINNPLEAVTNLLYIAAFTADETTKENIEAAQQELMRISQITAQTLQFRRQRSTPEPMNVVTLLRSVLTLYQGRFSQAGIEVLCEDRDAPHLVCYPGEIRQMLANFIGNALDAMPRGGRLRIRVRPATDWRDNSKGVRVSMGDNGHGMDAATRNQVYEPFYDERGDRHRTGTMGECGNRRETPWQHQRKKQGRFRRLGDRVFRNLSVSRSFAGGSATGTHERIVPEAFWLVSSPVGIYLSVPFCKAKCSFCNFASDAFGAARMDAYVDRLCSEMPGAERQSRTYGGDA